ncbi:MAG: two-component system, OmpR family, sensor kinase [Solirubrobacteraceae bacterium]|jgi:two-component system OmpR family sensor kinase|nr:two-component system, OmpR family, sensor kinase [Solirubrobacteraceae bacterium]
MRSLTVRLAGLLLVIVAAAIAVVYLYAVPPLTSKLRDEELRTLGVQVRHYAPPLQHTVATDVDVKVVDALVRKIADQAGARVTLMGINRVAGGLQATPRSDSTSQVNIADLQFPVAVQAAQSGRVVTGSEAGDAGRVGEAAIPLFFRDARRRREVGFALVFSRPLDDVENNVALVRNRILVAGAIGLGGALLAAFALARWLGRRIERLRRTARAVAAGDFTATFTTHSSDEIGLLARELDEMRGQLAQLDEARKRFIATASHELRTPIFSLGGFLELLADEDLDEHTRAQFLEQLRGQVSRLQKLATDLLDLSKLEAGSLELRPERTNVGVLTRALAAEFAPALAHHDSHLELRLAYEPMHATCDPERVAQILRILVDNALTHTPPGTPLVVTAARNQERDAALRLAVQDFGGGIHRTVLPHIFDPFYTSDDAQGSGLGLAIARELAERMDGTLAVATGGGTTTFTLEIGPTGGLAQA